MAVVVTVGSIASDEPGVSLTPIGRSMIILSSLLQETNDSVAGTVVTRYLHLESFPDFDFWIGMDVNPGSLATTDIGAFERS